MDVMAHPVVVAITTVVVGMLFGVAAYAATAHRERHVERKIAALLDHQETGYMPRATVIAAIDTLNSRLDRWESRMERLESRLGKTLLFDSPRLLDHMTVVAGRVGMMDGALERLAEKVDRIESCLTTDKPTKK